ncbi:MAG: hypothetical protein MUF04_09575, partial [Akkermansiaceae bacterium]|nr:hypothetical protein [Akkermansiaceae bacterium]
MNTNPKHPSHGYRGFALVITLSLMILLALLSVGLLSLSAVSLRASGQIGARAEAKANARLALMIALGELQKEMGPDMRVSAEAAIFDRSQDTEAIDDVDQPHWLASYDAWGDWLNARYTRSGGNSLAIRDTYTPRRQAMFRRWLLSLPEGMTTQDGAPLKISSWDATNSVVMVGEGTLGQAVASSQPEKITRAYLKPVGQTGRHAWWIGPENHKARIDLANKPRSLSNDAWETAQGDTAEVGAGSLKGLQRLDTDTTLPDRLITVATLRPAAVPKERVGELFYDLTATSRGVLASVRTGH